MSLMLDQWASGLCVFSSVNSLCISTISSFKTHSLGLPGLLVCSTILKLSVWDLTYISNNYAWDFTCFEMDKMSIPNCLFLCSLLEFNTFR